MFKNCLIDRKIKRHIFLYASVKNVCHNKTNFAYGTKMGLNKDLNSPWSEHLQNTFKFQNILISYILNMNFCMLFTHTGTIVDVKNGYLRCIIFQRREKNFLTHKQVRLCLCKITIHLFYLTFFVFFAPQLQKKHIAACVSNNNCVCY